MTTAYALIRPDRTVRQTSEQPFDLSEYPGHCELPLVGLINGVPLAEFPPVPEGATEVRAAYAPSDLLAKAFARAVQDHLDEVARSRDYDDSKSCVGYRGSKNAKWAAEAQAFADWRDDVWTYLLNTAMPAVLSEQRAVPTVDELIAEVTEEHPFQWPGE